MGLFQDQTVLITGASSGFGAETARLFAKEGAQLILIARRQKKLEELQEELKKLYGTTSTLMVLDVSNQKLVTQQLAQLSIIPHILINNAGMVRGMAKLWEVESEDWNEMIDTNIKGVLNITRNLLPKMLKENRGHIINVGSTSGHGVYPGGGVYCATKFALRALTDTLRMELVETPLRVSLISPGMANTEFSLVRFGGDQAKADQVYQGLIPLNSKDIAEAILFIASRPSHVNIGELVIYPKNQASSTLIHRG